MIEFTYLPGIHWLAAGAVVTLAALALSYRWAKGRSSGRLRWLLAGLRSLAIALVVFCLLGPEWVEAIKRQPKSRLAVLLDTSRSMKVKDVRGGRLAAAKEWLSENLTRAAVPGTAIEYYTFDRAVAPAASLDAATAEGEETALAEALEGLLGAPAADPLAGVILCSDGIETTQRDPTAAARLYRRKEIPVHTLTVGTTNDVQDIVLENVQVKRVVPNQAPARVAIRARALGYRDRPIPIQILRDNQVVAAYEVKLKDGAQQIDLEFVPRQKGFQVYEVRVPGQPGEWLTTNNRKMFGLDVIDPTVRVIYMEGTPQTPGSAIPEWKYLKDALESDPLIKVKTLYRQFGANGQPLRTLDTDPESGERAYPVEHPKLGFPRSLGELLEYDVIIHSDIRTDSFRGEQLQNMARLVEEFGGGFVMIGGNSAFGKGGYHRTILDRVIPVAMERENDSQARPLRVQVPASALTHPLIALGATRDDTLAIWTTKFPTLYGCNLVDRAKPGAVVLGIDPASRNEYGSRLILAVQNVGKGRSMAFTSDTTRSWGRDFETTWGEPINPALPLGESNCDSRYYRQFWVNAIRWLAAGRLSRTNNAVTLELAQGYTLPGEKVAATIKVRDRQLKPVPTAEVSLLLSSGGKTNTVAKLKFDRASQEYAGEFQPPAVGDFVVTAVATLNGAPLGDDRQLLVCEGGDREAADLRARPELMANLARVSGGQSFTAAAGDEGGITAIFKQLPQPTVEHRRTPLWDNAGLLGMILGLLTLEWATRRIKGMA